MPVVKQLMLCDMAETPRHATFNINGADSVAIGTVLTNVFRWADTGQTVN